MPYRKDSLIGRRFGRLLVIGIAETEITAHVWHRSVCLCDCGKTHVVRNYNLRNNRTKSCGCLMRDTNKAINTKHGQYGTGAYASWVAMKRRCVNPSSKEYPFYGGRGIKMCKRWDEFSNFYADMGERPEGHSIDRIDNYKGYSPDNCRWATRGQQQANKRKTVTYEVDGEHGCLYELARKFGLKPTTVRERMQRGWAIWRAFKEPVHVQSSIR